MSDPFIPDSSPQPPLPPPTTAAIPPPIPTRAPSQDDKTLAIVMHILCLIGFPIIGPLVVWLIKKDQSAYIDAQGRELLNFQISFAIYSFVAFLLVFVLVGFVVLPVVAITGLVLTIIGIVNASDGKVYRFPLTIRMF